MKSAKWDFTQIRHSHILWNWTSPVLLSWWILNDKEYFVNGITLSIGYIYCAKMVGVLAYCYNTEFSPMLGQCRDDSAAVGPTFGQRTLLSGMSTCWPSVATALSPVKSGTRLYIYIYKIDIVFVPRIQITVSLQNIAHSCTEIRIDIVAQIESQKRIFICESSPSYHWLISWIKFFWTPVFLPWTCPSLIWLGWWLDISLWHSIP